MATTTSMMKKKHGICRSMVNHLAHASKNTSFLGNPTINNNKQRNQGASGISTTKHPEEGAVCVHLAQVFAHFLTNPNAGVFSTCVQTLVFAMNKRLGRNQKFLSVLPM